MSIQVRYWAAIRAAADCNEETVNDVVETVEHLIEVLTQKHASADFTRILNGCSVLIDGRSVTRAARSDTTIESGQTVEFLPPFAGG